MQTANAPLKFGFSSLGCPDLDAADLRKLAAAFRSRFVEIRTLGGTVDFVSSLAQFPGGAAAVRDFFLESDVRVRLVGSSFLLTRATVAQRGNLVAEAEAGEALGAKWLRAFGGGEWGDPLTAEGIATARAHRTWWQALRAARGWTIDLVLEVHDAFSGSPQILEFFDRTGGPMPLLWDSHHTWKIGGESPAHTWSQLGANVVHVHMKDSVVRAWDNLPYAYTAPGQGDFPSAETLTLLQDVGFAGVVSLEWEKQWHPSLPLLESVLPDWNALTASFRRPAAPPTDGQPQLLYKSDFDRTQLVPSTGPYFHGAPEQYEDIVGPGPTGVAPGIGEPTPEHPRLGKLRIYHEGGDTSQRWARIVPDEADPANRILRFHISEPNVVIHWDTGPQAKARVQAEMYGNCELRDFYQTVRMRLPADSARLKDYPDAITWFTLMEFWDHAGWTDEPFPFRFSLHLHKTEAAPGNDLYFGAGSQYQVDEKTYVNVWQHVDHDFPVPFGVWMTVETYFKEGDADHGRFWAAVTPEGGERRVLFDIHNVTHHPKNPAPTGMKQFSPLKLYTSAELVEFMKAQGCAVEVDWDDFELWRGRSPG